MSHVRTLVVALWVSVMLAVPAAARPPAPAQSAGDIDATGRSDVTAGLQALFDRTPDGDLTCDVEAPVALVPAELPRLTNLQVANTLRDLLAPLDLRGMPELSAELPVDGSALASDAFFPFADGPQLAIDAGVRAIIQPGGSQRDQDVIDACDAAGIAMVFTARRHFRH